MKKLRVAFLVDTLEPDIYTNELIEFIDNSDFFARPTIITGYGNEHCSSKIQKLKSSLEQGPKSFVNQITKSLLYRLIRKIELKHVRKTYPNYRRNEKIKNLDNFDIVNVQGLWSKSKLYVEFSERDIEKYCRF
ncbi:hypothetical protein N9D73_00805 [Planktomarina temperata]|nr:hypothetical protein [Planktomarina temperata]